MPRPLITAQVRAMMANILAPNLTESITVKRAGVALDPQNVMFGRPIQQSVNEGEPISPGTVQLPVFGDTALDLLPDDTFTRTADGKFYTVIQPSTVATNGVSRTAIVEMRL